MTLRHSGLTWAALLWLSGPAVAHAQGGQTSAPLLQLPSSARALALGGASSALDADDAAVFYNPALIGRSVGTASASGSFQNYIGSSSLSAGSVAFSAGHTRIGIGVQALDYGSSPEIIPDPATGGQQGTATGSSVSAIDLAVTAGAAHPLNRFVTLGVAAKAVRERIAFTSAGTAAFDAGARVALPRSALLSIAVQNVGGRLAIAGSSSPLPTLARLGVAAPVYGDSTRRLAAVAEVMHVRGVGASVAGGVEGVWKTTGGVSLTGRIGARTQPVEELASPLTGGMSVALAHVALDYAYEGMRGLGGSHRVGLRWWQ